MRSSFQQNVSGFSTQIYTVKNTPTVFLFHNFKNYCSVSCRVFLFANPVNVFETKLNYFCLGHFPPKDILWSNLPRLFSQRINNSPITYPHYDSTFLNVTLSTVHTHIYEHICYLGPTKVTQTPNTYCFNTRQSFVIRFYHD